MQKTEAYKNIEWEGGDYLREGDREGKICMIYKLKNKQFTKWTKAEEGSPGKEEQLWRK